MRALIAAAVLGLIGCGGGSTPADALTGDWMFDPGGDGVVGLSFKGDGTYVAQIIRITSSASANDQAENGAFTADGHTLTMTPRKSSCPGRDPASSVTYAVAASTLSITDSSSAVLFTRVANGGPPSSVAVTFGCFDDAGNFAPSPIAPVSN